MGSNARILLAGALARRYRKGGHAWVFLNWMLGLRRLGYEVLFVDALETGAAHDATGVPCPVVQSANWRYLTETMESFGLAGAYALGGETWLGRTRDEVLDFARRADLLFNFMGYLQDPDVLAAVPRRVFVDVDPGFGQMWAALGLADVLSGHDTFVTVGENVGRGQCRVPTCGYTWLPVRPPVVLDEWPQVSGRLGEAFTSVCTWRGPFGPIDFAGRTYGLRAHEFRALTELPTMTGQLFRFALDIDRADEKDRTRLERAGWELVPPDQVAASPADYRRFIQGSAGELMVAKQMYVTTRSGWMSDRSACYLASGRPVVAQDTGWTENYPCDAGLLPFTTPEEAAMQIQAIRSEPDRHRAAAREVAEELFDSDTVLTDLLDAVSVRSPVP